MKIKLLMNCWCCEYIFVFSFLCFLLVAPFDARCGDLRPFSDSEADAIVLQGELEKLEQKQVHLAGMETHTAVARRTTAGKNGGSVTFEVIRPPDSSSPLKKEVIPAPEKILTAEETAAFQTSLEKSHKSLTFSATVYSHSITEVRWRFLNEKRQSAENVAFVNVDFSILSGITRIEASDSIYSLLMFAGERSFTDGLQTTTAFGKVGVPKLSDFPSNEASYFIVDAAFAGNTDFGEASADAEFISAMDALLDYYEKNKEELVILDQQRKAIAAARMRYAEANPPAPEAVKIQFWRTK